jgi:hypothetical protein
MRVRVARSIPLTAVPKTSLSICKSTFWLMQVAIFGAIHRILEPVPARVLFHSRAASDMFGGEGARGTNLGN